MAGCHNASICGNPIHFTRYWSFFTFHPIPLSLLSRTTSTSYSFSPSTSISHRVAGQGHSEGRSSYSSSREIWKTRWICIVLGRMSHWAFGPISMSTTNGPSFLSSILCHSFDLKVSPKKYHTEQLQYEEKVCLAQESSLEKHSQ